MLAKNKAVKIKIIPEILIKDLPDLSKSRAFFHSNPNRKEWIATENNRRATSKRFKTNVKPF
jgi:hypothetical protein